MVPPHSRLVAQMGFIPTNHVATIEKLAEIPSKPLQLRPTAASTQLMRECVV